MSVSINNLFNYSRSLPVPFDTMTNKKVKVASMYGAKTESTLCGSVIKAVHAMCRCMNGTGEGAVGQIDTNKSVAEYKSSVGPDAYHLVVFDAASGSALASVYDKNTELIEQYVAHPSQRDGAAIFFALRPRHGRRRLSPPSALPSAARSMRALLTTRSTPLPCPVWTTASCQAPPSPRM